MAHSVVCGITESGKTTICQIFANELIKQKKSVIVVDPYQSPKWGNVEFVKTAEELIKVLKTRRQVYFFVDESSLTIDRYEKTLYWLATNSRHYGHSAFFICQRVTQLHPNIRDQCVKAIIFKVSKEDANVLSQTYADPIVEKAASLKQFEFIRVSGFGDTVLGKVDVINRKILGR